MPEDHQLPVSPLRRSASGLLLFGINPFLVMLSLALWLVVLTATSVPPSSLVVLAIMQIVMVVVGCAMFLFRARVSDAEIVSGLRWRPRRVPLSEVVSVTIGKASRFGPRGSDATGLRLDLRGGRHVMVRESRSTSKKRLTEWGDLIRSHAPWIDIHESPISWESIRRDMVGSPLDESYRRTTP